MKEKYSFEEYIDKPNYTAVDQLNVEVKRLEGMKARIVGYHVAGEVTSILVEWVSKC